MVSPRLGKNLESRFPSSDGKPESHESPARANSISKAIPIIDPKTNEPIIEVAKPETETSHSTEATVNDPYSATESPAKEEEKPELVCPAFCCIFAFELYFELFCGHNRGLHPASHCMSNHTKLLIKSP